MLQVGSIVDGRYKIVKQLGQGGMSTVFLAWHEVANRTYAIKEVRRDVSINDEALIQSLVMETDMLKNLHHTHLVGIADVLDTESGYIIVMDLVEGKSLKDKLEKEGPQPLDAVLDWGKQVCDVIGYLHNQDPPIIYRDMKPDNLMLEPPSDVYPNGKIVLIDFGAAKKYKYGHAKDDTKPLGTVGYAAPEQYGGMGQTDKRTDIYNIGATLYHLITGAGPVDPPYYEMRPIGEFNAAYRDTGFEHLIQVCCRQNPDDRYQDCAELMYALSHVGLQDKKALALRRKKLITFLICFVLCITGAVGMLVTSSLKKKAEINSYDYYIKQADIASGFTEKVSLYKKCVDVDPTRADAYQGLVDEIAKDGQMGSEESAALKEFMVGKRDGVNDNLQLFQTADRDSADKLCYQIGIMYYFLSGNTNNSRDTAATYFGYVENSTALTEQQRSLAAILKRIGEYYGGLGSQASVYFSTGDSYKTLWEDLNAIMEGDVMAKVGGDSYGIALCSHIGYQIYMNYSNFASNGITKDEMLALLDQADGILEGRSYSDQNMINIRSEAESSIDNARKTVESYFKGK